MSFAILWARQPLAVLGKLTTGALIGAALAFATLLLTIFLATSAFILPLFIVAASLLIVGGIVATGIRWTPLLGTLAGLGTLIGGVFTQHYFVYHLTHPTEVVPFLLSFLICAFALVAICSGFGATLQNYRDTERKPPHWLATPLMGLTGFVLGAFLTAMLAATTVQPSAGATGINGTPIVHLSITSFVQSTVTIPKGTKLLFIDDGQFPHILDNGTWVNNTPHPVTEPGAPALKNLNVNGNSVTIGPFNTAGTFHIYCTIHPGMNLTIVVQ